jgi:Type II secretion system (T2SS), protein N
MLPSGWSGRLQASNLALRLQRNLLQSVEGQFLLHDLVDGRGNSLGSYRLEFPSAMSAPFSGSLRDAGGPLEVNAVLTVQPDRSWTLEGTATPRAGANEALLRNLQFLDAPDSSGRRHFSAAGGIN